MTVRAFNLLIKMFNKTMPGSTNKLKKDLYCQMDLDTFTEP